MKKVLFIFLSFCGIFLSQAQIKVRDSEVKNAPVFKPTPYDSLQPMTYHYKDKWDESMVNLTTEEVYNRNELDFKKYIGHSIYFIPLAKNATINTECFYNYNENKGIYVQDEKIKEKNKNSITTRKLKAQNVKSVLNGTTLEEYIHRDTINSYKFLNIYKPVKSKSANSKEVIINTDYNEIAGKYFKILDIQKVKKRNSPNYTTDYTKIIISNEQDTLYFLMGQYAFQGTDNFILVPYYEKIEQTFVGKNFIFQNRKQISFSNFKVFPSNRNDEKGNPYVSDINTGEQIILNQDSEWKCVSLEYIEVTDKNYLQLFFVLKNQLENKIIIDTKGSMADFFIEKEKYLYELEMLKKEESERQRIQDEERNKREIIKQKIANENIEKYGKYFGDLINSGKVVLGMNKEMCVKAWGKPIDINETIVTGLIHEQWVYSLSLYLYFENGKLTAIQK
jgi:hypothetical protein